MHSVLCMSPFSLNSERISGKKIRKKTAALSDLLHFAGTLFWHIWMEVILYGANCPVGKLFLWQVEANAA